MKWVTSVNGSLEIREAMRPSDAALAVGTAGEAAAGGTSPNGFTQALCRRAVHELLFDPQIDAAPLRPALAGVMAALGDTTGGPNGPGAAKTAQQPTAPQSTTTQSTTSAVVWCDVEGTLYPPALARLGVPLERLLILRPRPIDLAGVVAECLRCTGVAAVVATLPSRLTRVEARRIQLAAEHGGGVGLILRQAGRGDDIYAAATRWAVTAAPGDLATQRWAVRLLHGRGQLSDRSIGETFWLEGPRAPSHAQLDGQPLHINSRKINSSKGSASHDNNGTPNDGPADAVDTTDVRLAGGLKMVPVRAPAALADHAAAPASAGAAH